MRLRHGTQSKFIQNLKRFGKGNEKDQRDAYHQVMQDKQLLKRTQKVGAGDGESSYSDDSDSDPDDDVDDVKQKALNKINAEMSQEEDDGSESSDSDDDFN